MINFTTISFNYARDAGSVTAVNTARMSKLGKVSESMVKRFAN